MKVAFSVLISAVVGFIFVIAMAFPLVPKTSAGWLAGIFGGSVIGVWAYTSGLLIYWLTKQERLVMLSRTIAVLIAVSVGAGVFWIVLNAQAFFKANFSYFGL